MLLRSPGAWWTAHLDEFPKIAQATGRPSLIRSMDAMRDATPVAGGPFVTVIR